MVADLARDARDTPPVNDPVADDDRLPAAIHDASVLYVHHRDTLPERAHTGNGVCILPCGIPNIVVDLTGGGADPLDDLDEVGGGLRQRLADVLDGEGDARRLGGRRAVPENADEVVTRLLWGERIRLAHRQQDHPGAN
jgi:hypothetical protein